MALQRPTTPNLELRAAKAHYSTPTKTAVRSAVHFAERMNLSYRKQDVFETFNVSTTRGYDDDDDDVFILRYDTGRRPAHAGKAI